ncbi:MAG TPA: hypothetical protein VF213_06200, partial [Dongiaceae bacterium]
MSAVTTISRTTGPLRDGMADAAGLVAYATEPRRRRRTAANHRRLDPQIDRGEARRRARVSFRAYARVIGDFLWACGMDESTVLANSVVIGMENIDAARDGGGILTIAHHGNWDMAGNIACAKGLALTTVMAPIGTRRMTELVVWARQRNQLEVFAPDR